MLNRFLKLSPYCSLKILEKPYLYDIKNDELYELDECAEDFIKKCNGITPINPPTQASLECPTPFVKGGQGGLSEEEFINFCLKENLLEISDKPKSIIQNSQFTIHNYNSPIPSLRYLELQLTGRCNLSCKHCYLGKPRDMELNLNSVKGILKDFEDMQGLRLLISGGEPLLYSYFWKFNEMLPDYNFRKVLLTNGWFLKKEEVSRLNVHEVQVSLDGLKKGHDMLRGNGSFKKAVTAMNLVKDTGIDLSVATMVHPYNINDFMAMADMLENYNLREWGIDIPLVAGNLKIEKDFVISPEKGAEYLKFAFGGSYHGGSEGYACGRHICTIMPSGKVCKCGFYEDQPLGNIEEGLRICWERNYHIPLKELLCYDCSHIEECQGGCRFRAETSTSPDPIMCAFYQEHNFGKVDNLSKLKMKSKNAI
jgi:radical SAM protein with 4Fe4S-binding SPASM domain